MLPTMHYRVPSKALEKAVHSFMFPPDARITPHLSLSVHTILQLHIFSSIACQMFQGVLHGANTLLSLPLTLVSNLIPPELDCLFLAPHRSMPSSWLMPLSRRSSLIRLASAYRVRSDPIFASVDAHLNLVHRQLYATQHNTDL